MSSIWLILNCKYCWNWSMEKSNQMIRGITDLHVNALFLIFCVSQHLVQLFFDKIWLNYGLRGSWFQWGARLGYGNFCFRGLFTGAGGVFISWGGGGPGRWAKAPWSFEIFLILFNFLSLKSLSNSWSNSYIPVYC